MKHRLLRVIPPVSVFLLTWSLSDTPGLKSDFMPAIDFFLRKGAHITIFLLQYLTIFWSILPKHNFRIDKQKFIDLNIISAITTFILALYDEWHQIFVSGRTAQPLDIVYNSLGIIIGYCIIFTIWKIFHFNLLQNNFSKKY